MADGILERGGEALQVARVMRNGIEDKTSAKRLREILGILRAHHVNRHIEPADLVATIEDLGPTFVKAGQIMSSRRDLFPAKYCDALANLRTKARPMTFSQVEARLNDAYGGNWGRAFASIDATPLGSASVAQVHKAILADNKTVVAVKVQRPGIKDQMLKDLELLRRANDLLELSTMDDDEQGIDFAAFVDEFDRTTREELDFRAEARNLRDFHANCSGVARVTSPAVYDDLTRETVLVMDYVVGPHADDKQAMATMGVSPDSVGKLITQDYIRQMLTDGLFHADPHPGNIIVQKDGGIEWIDLGMVGRLSPTERGLLGKILLGVATRDPQMLKDALLTWGHAGDSVDHGKLLAEIDAMVARYSTSGLAGLDVSAAVSDLLSVLQKQHIAMPASFTMLSRGLITFEGTIEAISPNLSIMGAVTDYLTRHLLDDFDLRNEFISGALDAYKIAKKTTGLPSQLSNLLDMASKGQIGMNMNVRDLDRPLSKLESTIDRMTLGLIVAGLFIGSSLLCLTAMEPRVLGVPIIGFLGYLGALALSVYIVVKGRP